jgi:monoterpene epsilon-lactone hydrolase
MPSAELARARDWGVAFGKANAAAEGVDEVRDVNAKWLVERAGTLPADLVVEPVDAGGVAAEWLSIEGNADDPVVLFLHGGGFILGSAAENREWVGRLVRHLGGRALAIDYRLAPEHPYPAQVEDARTAYRWLLDAHVSPSKIALLGESAGGCLVAATLLATRDAGDPLPAASVMTSPFLDMTLSGTSLDHNDDPFVGREGIAMMVDAALQGQDAREHSPLFAELKGLPPLLIQAGTAEAIFDDARRFADKARAAGVDVTFEPWDDMIHLWHGFPYLPEAQQGVERIAGYLGERLDGPGRG